MEKLLDNTVRGRRTIFWMKALFAMTIVMGALMVALYEVSKTVSRNLEGNDPVYMALLMVAVFGCGIVLLVCFAIQGCYWISWIYRAVANLKKLGPTKFSPLVAVILSIVPYIGLILHYFVFRDIAEKIDAKLTELGVTHQPVPVNRMSCFAVLTVFGFIITIWHDHPEANLVAVILGLSALGCYISALGYCVRQEVLLLTAGQEEIIRRKVDEEIRKREFEKASAQTQEATYEKPL